MNRRDFISKMAIGIGCAAIPGLAMAKSVPNTKVLVRLHGPVTKLTVSSKGLSMSMDRAARFARQFAKAAQIAKTNHILDCVPYYQRINRP